MSTLKSCCCGCSVRTGAILSGIYTLILSILNCCLTVYSLLSLQLLRNSTENNTDLLNYHVFVTSCWLYAIISLSTVLLLTSLLLIIGVTKDVKWLLLPWMVVLITTIFLDVAVLIYDCAIFGMLSFNLVQMFLWLLSTLLNIYCLLCVLSQYRNISAGRTGRLDNRQQREGLIMYSTTIQHVHFNQGPVYVQCPAEPSAAVMTTLLTTTGLPLDKQGAKNELPKSHCNRGLPDDSTNKMSGI